MKHRFKIDFWLLIPVSVLLIISLTTLFSLNIAYFKNQLISLIVALIAFLLFSQSNVALLKRFSLHIYIFSLLALSVVLFIGIESRGAVRWIDIVGLRIQFSELLKPFLALAFASYVARQEHFSIKSFFFMLLLLLPLVTVISLQPDLGTGLLYLFTAIFVLLIIGIPLGWFVLCTIPLLFGSPILWTMMHEYQRQRVLNFLHPTADPLGTSYNSVQAIIAVGAGAFWGKGLSQGTQSILRFLPERHTDFIFASIAEGLGFMGAGIVIVALVFLCWRIYIIFTTIDELFSKVFAACCFGFIILQAFVNIGMNIGVVPIVGITLPFVSFGGNSLLSNFIFLGILSSLYSSQRRKEVLRIR